MCYADDLAAKSVCSLLKELHHDLQLYTLLHFSTEILVSNTTRLTPCIKVAESNYVNLL